MGMLGGYEGEKLALATMMMTVMGGAVCLYAATMFTTVLLQSHGKAHIPVINTLICGGVKLALMYMLVGNPNVGIMAVPVCSALCYLSVSALNLWSIRKVVPQKPRLLRNMLRPLLPAALMGAVVYGVYWLMVHIAGITSNMLLCGVPIMVGVVVYFVLVVVCKAITKEDCLLLPKGEKIAKLLKL